MAEAPAPPAALATPLTGYRSNDEWDALLARAQQGLDAVQAIADDDVRARVMAVLDDIDQIHREALHRLVRLFKEGVLEQVATDPAIHTLLELYDLLPPAAAPREVRAAPVRFMRKEEWRPAAAAAASSPAAAKPLPHWLPSGVSVAILEREASVTVDTDAGPVLVALGPQRQVFAVDARCSANGQPMVGAALRHYTLVCPHHAGCFYDVRSGKRLGQGGSIQPLATRTSDAGVVLLGIGVPYQPPLPT